MGRRALRFVLFVLAGVIVVASLPPVPVIAGGAGQASQGNQANPARKAAYKAPRTAWGDPDLQGNFTNLYEAGTPLERPDEFAGRKLSDITPAELRAAKKAIQDNTIQRFETPFDAPSNWWQVAFRLEDGAQAWLITDPEDGRIPPLTPEGRQRVALRAADHLQRRFATPTKIAACTIAASRAAFPARACRRSTATPRASCRVRDSSRSSTR